MNVSLRCQKQAPYACRGANDTTSLNTAQLQSPAMHCYQLIHKHVWIHTPTEHTYKYLCFRFFKFHKTKYLNNLICFPSPPTFGHVLSWSVLLHCWRTLWSTWRSTCLCSWNISHFNKFSGQSRPPNTKLQSTGLHLLLHRELWTEEHCKWWQRRVTLAQRTSTALSPSLHSFCRPLYLRHLSFQLSSCERSLNPFSVPNI